MVPPENPTRVRITPGAQPNEWKYTIETGFSVNKTGICVSYQTVPQETKIRTFQMKQAQLEPLPD